MEDSNTREGDQYAAEITAAVGAAALGVGTAILTNPAGGAIVSAAAAPTIKAALDRVLGLRGRQVAAMVDIAVRAAGQTHDELLQRVTADPHRAQLFAAAVRAAANTALESKLKVLGRLLAQGLLDDGEDPAEEARLLISAIEDIERLHLRVLYHLENGYTARLNEEEPSTAFPEALPTDAWPFEKLAEELTVNRSALEMLIGSLTGRNLIHGSADVYGVPEAGQMHWRLTDTGRAILERFREAGEAAASAPAPAHEQ
jgi:DNA-binding MarR family transcriptional regulator